MPLTRADRQTVGFSANPFHFRPSFAYVIEGEGYATEQVSTECVGCRKPMPRGVDLLLRRCNLRYGGPG